MARRERDHGAAILPHRRTESHSSRSPPNARSRRRRRTAAEQRLPELRQPERLSASAPAQRAGIEGWFKEFEDVLWNNSPSGATRRTATANISTPEDFADYFLLNTLTRQRRWPAHQHVSVEGGRRANSAWARRGITTGALTTSVSPRRRATFTGGARGCGTAGCSPTWISPSSTSTAGGTIGAAR